MDKMRRATGFEVRLTFIMNWEFISLLEDWQEKENNKEL